MKSKLRSRRTLGVILAVLGSVLSASGSLIVHEWGTFTSVSGSDGGLLPGLEREEQLVPTFVHSHAGFFPATKGWNRPVANVTIKMETPVIYFYSDLPQPVQVDVGFRGGSISQWYPERSGGEQMAPIPSPGIPPAAGRAASAKVPPPIDFAQGYQGAASWKVDVLAPGAEAKFTANGPWTPAFLAQWPRARVTGANKVRGPGRSPEVEGFIFYRGIGNFPLPLSARCADGKLKLLNSGREEIPFLFVYEKGPAFPQGAVWWSGPLAGGGETAVALHPSSGAGGHRAAPVLAKTFPHALEAAGLSPDEARALIATWQESYFDRDGLRVFWIVPRAFTDAVLPISITPRPDRLERVLVGRSEVLTPSFEKTLTKDFAAKRGRRWENDRYYLAYRERARQLGVVLAAARP